MNPTYITTKKHFVVAVSQKDMLDVSWINKNLFYSILHLNEVHSLPPLIPPIYCYRVYISLEIRPETWFRRLALSCWRTPVACHCEEERRSNRKNYGIMRLLRFARNDNLKGLEGLKPLQIELVYTP
ncbi:hypothetical protein [Nostoc sp. ChiQUE01b]|uniref:hypothetical protein n=1 Tax=Nostoc sp. ChiQUE01b TaxID=3075376 RepID=UPI002AD4B6D2|nr:hypothetical protein [Nostoc sp. ChiQUE01b]MDZ8263810.1 hypothetical protein [Nostoc sp. ChiQUE01b]